MLQHPALAPRDGQRAAKVSATGRHERGASDCSSVPCPAKSFELAVQLKSNTVVVLRSLAVEGETKLYGVRHLPDGVRSLQIQGGLRPCDPAVHLVVLNQNGNLGFRSAMAEGKLLCCNPNYQLAFELWDMDYQEAWRLHGYSLKDCTLRNQKYKLTLNVGITVVAEPTDLLGNTRITSALLANLMLQDTVHNFKSSSGTPVSSKRSPGLNGTCNKLFMSSCDCTRSPGDIARPHKECLVEVGECNCATLVRNSGLHTRFPFTSAQYRDTVIQESGSYYPSSMVKFSTCTSDIDPHKKRIIHGDEAYHQCLLVEQTSQSRSASRNAINCDENLPHGGNSHSSVGLTRSCIYPPDFKWQGLGSQMNDTQLPWSGMLEPIFLSKPGEPRKARKWKRKSEFRDKVLETEKSLSCGQKGTEHQETSDRMDIRSSSPEAVEKVVDSKLEYVTCKNNATTAALTRCSTLERTYSWNGKLRFHILEASFNAHKTATARKDREKVIQWKLQASVQLLTLLTKQKLESAAKTSTFQEVHRNHVENVKRKSICQIWEMGTTWMQKVLKTRGGKTKGGVIGAPEQTWNHPELKVVLDGGRMDQTHNVCTIVKRRPSHFPLFLKLWLYFPVPLVSLAYLLSMFRRNKY